MKQAHDTFTIDMFDADLDGLKANLYSQIDNIMKRTDFDRVHKTMQALDWKWLGKSPTVEEIRKTAYRLLNDAVKYVDEAYEYYGEIPGHYSVATGGFTASIYKNMDGALRLELSFRVADTRYR